MKRCPRHATPRRADPCAGGAVVDPSDGSASHAVGAGRGDARATSAATKTSRTRSLDAQDSLERRIRAHLAKGRVQVTLTDNRYTMISVRRLAKEKRYEVRLHHMFADADPVITRALARYIADNDADASRVLGDFIDRELGPRPRPRAPHADAGDLHRRRAPRPPPDLRRAQRALLRQQDRRRDHVGRSAPAARAAATRSRWAATPSRIG